MMARQPEVTQRSAGSKALPVGATSVAHRCLISEEAGD